eukprot:UN04724
MCKEDVHLGNFLKETQFNISKQYKVRNSFSWCLGV